MNRELVHVIDQISFERGIDRTEVIQALETALISASRKRLDDFRRHAGERAVVKTFAPLPDGQRRLVGRVTAVAGGVVLFTPDNGSPVSLEFSNIASARPEIDWAALLRGRRRTPGGGLTAAIVASAISSPPERTVGAKRS